MTPVHPASAASLTAVPVPRADPDLSERLRVAALHAYQVLDRAPIADLDGLAALAAYVTGTSYALVNLLDEDRMSSAAAAGGPRTQCSRDDALCRYAVEEQRAVHTPDASTDPRFRDNPFVDGRAGDVRLYAAAPLTTPDGYTIGTLCVLDETPRALTTRELGALGLLADQVVALLEERRRSADQHRALEDLDRVAHVDPLTGLVNRTAALRSLERVCQAGGWALLFIDVDDFKAINDRSGHDTGDGALREIARRLSAGLRPHDLLARWAGDEFVALLSGVRSERELTAAVGRLSEVVSLPFTLDGTPLQLSVSIGGRVVEAGADPQQALRAADLAMYDAKRRHKRVAAQDRPAGR